MQQYLRTYNSFELSCVGMSQIARTLWKYQERHKTFISLVKHRQLYSNEVRKWTGFRRRWRFWLMTGF